MMADKRADYVQTQRQINDLILGQNTASEAGNALLALQIERRRVMLESGLEQVKLQEDTNRKLAESATNQDQQNKGLRDAVILVELNATVTERREATRFRLAEIDQRIAAQRKKEAGELLDLERERAELLADSMARMTELTTRNSLGAGAQQGIQAYVDSIGNLRDAMGQLTTTAIGGLEESLTSLATTGTANFREFAASILKDTTRMIIRQLILKSIMQLLGGIGGSATAKSFEMPGAAFIPSGGYSFAPSAMSNVFASNGIQPFANGGIVSRPTLFPFAKGIGLMGEEGPEGILPLRRGKDGKLGVIAGGGGGSTTINISVDAKGSSVQGDNGQSGALARAIAGAVQNELIKQKRPGGILTS
jgi:lambda family phage tail tape measure protein